MNKSSTNSQKPSGKFSLGRNSRIAILLLMFTAVLSLVVAANRWSSNQDISEIIITGAVLIPHSEINELLSAPILNRPKENVKLKDVELLAEKHPYVFSANAAMLSSNILKLEVKERIPEAIVTTPGGDVYYCDKFGALLPYRLFPNVKNLPLITNVFPTNELDTAALTAAVRIWNNIVGLNSDLMNFFISEVRYEPSEKSFTMISCEHSLKILIGKVYNIEKKLRNLERFCISILSKEQYKNINYIDLRWESQVVVG